MSQSEAGDGTTRRSTRNPRRRQRQESESLNNSQPRRKRSKIDNDTFKVPDEAGSVTKQQNGGLTVANGHVRSTRSVRRASVQPEREATAELVVRGAKKTSTKRAARSDGSTVLAQNEHYSVRQLPSTPDTLRNSASGEGDSSSSSASSSLNHLSLIADYRGSILHSPPLALAVTRERAYIWDYTSPTPVTHPRTFDVSQPAKVTDPLPIGSLVSHANSRAIGLIIISSTTGHITYWENIDTAESLSLFQQRSTGTEGSLGGLFTGESVVDITSAEHAGLVITLSSGRIAQVCLTDPQGKPKITATFLRSNDAAGGGGLFGSIKSTFGLAAWKRDVVAVHTRPLGARREMQLLAATENAQIQIWELSWSGQSVFKGNYDFKDMFQREIGREKPVKVLDMAITPIPARGDEMVTTKTDTPLDLMLLVQFQDDTHLGPRYVIANIIMSGSHARIERLIRIRPETAPITTQARPRLYVPKPGHTAFVVADQQIIIASLTAPLQEGPEAQLLIESKSDPGLFQDTLWLRTGKHFVIEGFCEEDMGDGRGLSACAIFVKSFGMARITANEPTGPVLSRPTIKSKIEQAIFYGTMSDNIFDMARPASRAETYTVEEVELAALRISSEIIKSTTAFLPAAMPTMEAHLASRMKAARALIMYLSKHYPGISRTTSWKLMTDAEKLAAAHAVWIQYDTQLVNASATSPKPIMLPLAIKAADKNTTKTKAAQNAATSQEDPDSVRQWFANEVANLGHLRSLVLNGAINIYEKHNTHKDLMRIISEAHDIIFSIYETVFAFRSENAETYGFSYAVLAEGILEEGWEDLPEPWTSNHDVFNAYNKFIDVARDCSINIYENDEGNVYVEKVVPENVKLVTILCMMYRERWAYIKVHHGERGEHYPQHFGEAFVAARSHHLRLLGKIGQDFQGIAVAEKYHDLDTMVELVMNQTTYLHGEMDKADEVQKGLIRLQMADLDAIVQRYFRDLGQQWANAFFDAHLQNHKSYGLLLEADRYKAPLTKYLRADKSRGRVGWIHDVLREQDFSQASHALSLLATEQEGKMWNKKVELSLAKLASLAAREEKGSMANGALSSQLEQQEDDLTVLRIQESVKAAFQPLLYGAVDAEAEVQIVSDAYAGALKRKTPSFHSQFEITLEDLLKNLVLSPERLIDVLTLMESTPVNVPESDIAGTEFVLALQVLQAARKSLDAQKFDVLHRLIWKRCWLSDEWDLINNTKKKSDKLVTAQLRESAVCRTVALGLKESLFAAGTGITPLAPTSTLGAGCHREDIAYRFLTDDIISPMLADNIVQDEQLRSMIDSCRLEHWHSLIQEEAKKVVEEQMAMQKAADEEAVSLAKHLAEVEEKEKVMVGSGEGLQGVSADDAAEDEEGDGDADGDGDVDMS